MYKWLQIQWFGIWSAKEMSITYIHNLFPPSLPSFLIAWPSHHPVQKGKLKDIFVLQCFSWLQEENMVVSDSTSFIRIFPLPWSGWGERGQCGPDERAALHQSCRCASYADGDPSGIGNVSQLPGFLHCMHPNFTYFMCLFMRHSIFTFHMWQLLLNRRSFNCSRNW